MYEPLEDGIGEGVIADDGIPLVDRQLADHHGGGGVVAVIRDVHEVVALCGVEGVLAVPCQFGIDFLLMVIKPHGPYGMTPDSSKPGEC